MEKNRLMVFENRVLRRIFGPKREMTGGWRKLYNEELHNSYSLPSIIRIMKSMRIRRAGLVSRMGDIGGEARRKETTWKTMMYVDV
jgi:hypothetical protein